MAPQQHNNSPQTQYRLHHTIHHHLHCTKGESLDRSIWRPTRERSRFIYIHRDLCLPPWIKIIPAVAGPYNLFLIPLLVPFRLTRQTTLIVIALYRNTIYWRRSKYNTTSRRTTWSNTREIIHLLCSMYMAGSGGEEIRGDREDDKGAMRNYRD